MLAKMIPTIDKIGLASIGGGLAVWAAEAYEKSVNFVSFIFPAAPQTLAEWAALCSCVGAVSYAIKNFTYAYIKFKRRHEKSDDLEE